MNAELDPKLLAELRELHHGERAPAELEQSVLRRLLPAPSSAPLAARLRAWWRQALSREQRLGWTVLGATCVLAAAGVMYLGAQALSREASRIPGPEPRLEAAGDVRKPAACPLDELPPGFNYDPTRIDPELAHAGLQLETFAMPIPGCPDLVRRALRYVPPGLLRGPVVIVLHDAGDSAEGVRARLPYRGFERLAEGVGFIVVYASAAPAAGHSSSSGVWQTDPGANRAIDDFAYLTRIVERLDARGLLHEAAGFGHDVYLVGYGSGAQLALEAAARHPERYTGVAAILPDQLNRSHPPPRPSVVGTKSEPPVRPLSRVLFVTLQDPGAGGYWAGAPLNAAALDEWSLAVGLPHITTPLSRQPDFRPFAAQVPPLLSATDAAPLVARGVLPAGTLVFDNPNPDKGGPVVRTVVVQSKAVLEAGPSGSPAPLDSAALSWELFQRGVPRYPGRALP